LKTPWHRGLVTWHEQGCFCISAPFTWLLPKARELALLHSSTLSLPRDRVVVGGPAVRLMPEYVQEWAEIETIKPLSPPLRRANHQASRTTFGCPNRCAFCGVHTIEGEYRELTDFTPAPILCDSNFLACSDEHFNYTIDRMKTAAFDGVDFNQGLDAALLTTTRASRLAELHLKPRFAWDTAADEGPVMAAVELLERVGMKCRAPSSKSSSTAPVRVYVLVGWKDTPDEAMYRLETLRNARLSGVAMRYQPLDTLKRNKYCPAQWDSAELADFCRYWNRQRWFGGFTFEQYRQHRHSKEQTGQTKLM